PRRPPRVYRVVATARSAAQSASPTTEPAARPGASLNIAVLAARNAATSVVPAMDTAINAANAGFVDPRTIDVIDPWCHTFLRAASYKLASDKAQPVDARRNRNSYLYLSEYPESRRLAYEKL